MKSTPKLPAVDVLRGIAALGVTWFHSRVDLWVGFKAIHADPTAYSRLEWALSFFSLPASQMGGMVMLFFVLSGFCIHLPVAKKKHLPNWKAYALRRFFRIYPPYLVTLVSCFLVAWLLRTSWQPSEQKLYGASAALLQNWFYAGGQVGMNPSLWSIPVEVEFYLVYPLLLLIWHRFGGRTAVAFTFICTGIGGVLFFLGSKLSGEHSCGKR